MKRIQIAFLIGIAIALIGLALAPQPSSAAPLAQATPTPTPTRLSNAVKLLLKGISKKSPDSTGNGITASLRANLPLGDESAIDYAGNIFEYIQTDGPKPDGVNFEIATSDGFVVYRHTELNPPYCPFGDNNTSRCNGFASRDGRPWWPKSDDDDVEQTQVQAGDYIISVRTIFNSPDRNEFWGTAQPFDYRIEFGAVQTLPPLTGKAALSAPPSGSVVRGVVNVRGAATSNNFGFYKFELLDSRCDRGVCFLIDFRRAVNNGVLWRWDTRAPLPNGVILPNGSYVLQLTVADKFGRTLPDKPQFQITIQN